MNEPTTSTVLSIGGALIRFNVPEAALAEVQAAFEFAPVSGAPTESSPVSYRSVHTNGSTRFVRHDPLRSSEHAWTGSDVESLIDDLHLTIALHAPEDVYVHAGVVIWQDSAIVIPGRSRSGKSTLVEALVRAGATYSSDEYAVVRPGAMIGPYTRPIHLRTPSGRRLVDAATLGPVAESPAPAGLIVFTSFSPAAPFEPIDVPPAAAALKLFDNTVIAEVAPERATAAVAQIARTARCMQSPRPDVASVVPRILELAVQNRVAS